VVGSVAAGSAYRRRGLRRCVDLGP
jgi:hypothetical protein